MHKQLVIGLCGYPGCGKDEFFNQVLQRIESHFFYRKEKFAYGIQDIVAVMGNFYQEDKSHREQFEDRQWKETASLTLGGKTGTPRYFLQQIGTEVFRDSFSKDVWVSQLDGRIASLSPDKTVFITDLRFENEYQYLRKQGGILIYIDRDYAEKKALTDPALSHASEQFIPELKQYADIVLPNQGSMSLYQKSCRYVIDVLSGFIDNRYKIVYSHPEEQAMDLLNDLRTVVCNAVNAELRE